MRGRGALAGLVVVGVLLVWLVPDLYNLLFASHPIQDGSELIYALDEDLGRGQERSYGVKMRFRARPQGGFRLDINSPHGVRSLDVFEDSLLPTADRSNEPLEFVTESGMEVRPATVWLPKS